MILYNGQMMNNNSSLFSSNVILGTGIFETLTVYHKKAIDLNSHIDRLFFSLKFFNLYVEISKQELISQVEYFIKHIDEKKVALRITVIQSTKNEPADIIISANHFPYQKEDYERGFKISRSSVIRHRSNPLLYHKTTNYLLNKLELEKAQRKGYDEVIFLNEIGAITEGTRSNIFLVCNGNIYTPKTSCGLLEGVTRNKIINIAKKLGFNVIIDTIPNNFLETCDEAFLTSSLLGIMPISQIENRKLNRSTFVITPILLNEINIEM
ncbi:aminotransferase class IV [Tepidibacillus fermentans]|uniref:4-amino-4-deoxychorismate lyase n=1 Tax=Tepidibacillus fermentans TaxID=1281767 RepID=A0A4R3KBR3_9BACI|nr:aminotransferase class IV [Tepidibacillus fermentans]TCS80339.1 4-amino-4-deoxychorismate lyase [Tepidibacillus fermentans]